MQHKAALLFLGVMVLSASKSTSADLQPAPKTQVIAKTAIEFWKAKKYSELQRYLTVLSQKFPKLVASQIGASILDNYYRGDDVKAKSRLEVIDRAVDAHTISGTAEFNWNLAAEIWKLAQAPEFRSLNQLTIEDTMRGAKPEHVRAVYGGKIPPLFELLSLAPDADLP